MRHLQTDPHFRLALFAVQDPDGYVDALLAIARQEAERPRSTTSPAHPQLWLRRHPRKDEARLH